MVEETYKYIYLTYLSTVRSTSGKLAEPTLYEDVHYKKINNGKNMIQTQTTNESAFACTQGMIYPEDVEKIFVFTTDKVLKNMEITEGEGKGESHYSFFRERIKRYLHNPDMLEEILPAQNEPGKRPATSYKCNDTEDAIKSMQSVIGMAGLIIDYLSKQNKNISNYRLYVDLTGGPRDAVMILLQVIRLLDFRGLKLKQAFYSHLGSPGKVYECKEIYMLQDFISGAAEFTHFGSVKQIREYFNRHEEDQSDEMKRLLEAMNTFADAIKLCRRGEFTDSIRELKEAKKEFVCKFEGKSSLIPRDSDMHMTPVQRNDSLARLISARIEEEYHDLFEPSDEVAHNAELAQIQWCAKKGYLQQALILCRECVPLILFDKKYNILKRTSKGEEALGKKLGQDQDPWEVRLLSLEKNLGTKASGKMIHDRMEEIKLSKKYANCYRQIFKKIENIRDKQDGKYKEGDIEDLSQYLREYGEAYQFDTTIQEQMKKAVDAENWDSLKTDVQQTMAQTIRNAFSIGSYLKEATDKESGYICRTDDTWLQTLITAADGTVAYEGLPLSDQIKITDDKELINILKKYPHCMQFYGLIKDGEIEKPEMEEVYSVMEIYYRLKLYRNDSAHANIKQREIGTGGDVKNAVADIEKLLSDEVMKLSALIKQKRMA